MKQTQITLRDGIHVVMRHWPVAEPRGQVLIVHGLGEHSGRWDHVAQFLSDRGLDVHAYDLRGHGLSGGPKLDIALGAIMRINTTSDYYDYLFRKLSRSGIGSVRSRKAGVLTFVEFGEEPSPAGREEAICRGEQ